MRISSKTTRKLQLVQKIMMEVAIGMPRYAMWHHCSVSLPVSFLVHLMVLVTTIKPGFLVFPVVSTFLVRFGRRCTPRPLDIYLDTMYLLCWNACPPEQHHPDKDSTLMMFRNPLTIYPHRSQDRVVAECLQDFLLYKLFFWRHIIYSFIFYFIFLLQMVQIPIVSNSCK